jgi:hypothetical protein
MNKNIYLGLAVLGLVLPYSQFVPFIFENGLDVILIVDGVVSSRIAAFGWLDVVVTAITVMVMVYDDKDSITYWWALVVATLLVGPSFSLPLYLLMKK